MNGVSEHLRRGAIIVSGEEFHRQGRKARRGQMIKDTAAARAIAGQTIEINNLPPDSLHRRLLTQKRAAIFDKLVEELGSRKAAVQMVEMMKKY